MGKDLRGKELGVGISQRKGGLSFRIGVVIGVKRIQRKAESL